MLRNRWIGLLLLVGGCIASASANEFDLPDDVPAEPFDIQAVRLEYTNNMLIASGGVTGRFENVTVRADSMSGNADTGDLRLEGDVHFQRDDVIWQGTELDYNYITQDGAFGPSSLNFDPVLMSVDHVERVSTNEYLLKGATFTTCAEDHPHFHVRAKEARLVDETYLKARGVTVYLGKVPVLYVPYWCQKLKDRIFTFKVGYSSEWGPFALVKATVPVTEEIDWISDINVYGKRGVGLGQGFAWDFPQAEGEFSAFYLNDSDPHSRFDDPPVSDQIDADRYRFKLEHLQYFTETDYLNTKWNYLSDPAVTEEFFKSEFRNNRQPENYANWVVGRDYGAGQAFITTRLNDYYDNVNREGASADLYRTKLGNSPFYFQSQNEASYLERVYAETNKVDSAYNSVRLDSFNAITLPQRYGFLSVVPRATYRATYYSKTADSGGEEVRNIAGGGMEVSVQAAKVLSEKRRWYGQGLRHKIEPYADYIYEDTSIDSDDLLHFDSVDTLEDENKVRLGLRNVFQTKRDGRLARFIDLDVYTHYLVDNSGTNDFDQAFFDARMPLTKRTMVDIKGEYNWYTGRVPFFNARVSHRQEEVIYSMEYLYRDPNLSLWTPRVTLFPEGDISFEAYARYDDKENDLQEISGMVFKNYCCMRYGLGLRFYDDSEYSVMLSIGLSAFPSIGM